MGSKVKKTCRLCLGDSNDNFVIVEQATKEKFDFLLLKMNLSITEEPVICKNCSDSVLTYFDFKSTCICAEDSKFPFISDSIDAKTNLPVLHCSTNENVVTQNYSICRFCIKYLKEMDYMMLNELKETKTLIENMFARCIPEIELKFFEKPVICTTCMDNLKGYFSFLTNCSDVEERISKYIKVEGTNKKGHIELSNVVQFLFKNLSQIKTEPTQAEDMETEISGIDNGDVEIKSDSYVKIAKQELDIKDEKIETLEKNYCGSFEVDMLALQQNANSKLDFIHDPGTEIYKCKMCTFQTKLRGSLNWHKLIHKGPSGTAAYECQFCNFQTKYMGSLKNHMLGHKDSSEITMYKCETCEYQTRHKSSIRNHMLFHKNPSEITVLKCQMCSFRTKYKWSLQSHMLVHKETSEVAMHKCQKCAFQSKHKVSLRKHIKIHNKPSDTAMHKCQLCAFQTKHQRSLQKHILNHKKASEVTMYKCETCTYQTKHKKCIRTHMLIHTDPSAVTTHKCQLCPFLTKYKFSLQSHMLTHKEPSEIAMYKCELCAFETKRKQGLHKHMLYHKKPSEIIMYKCEACTFQTKYRGSIQRHMLTHREATRESIVQMPHEGIPNTL